MKSSDPMKSVDNLTVVRATEKAILVKTVGGKENWIPKSQIHEDSQIQSFGDEGTLIISEWIYNQKEWDKEEDETGEL
jgi:hypothetical protein